MAEQRQCLRPRPRPGPDARVAGRGNSRQDDGARQPPVLIRSAVACGTHEGRRVLFCPGSQRSSVPRCGGWGWCRLSLVDELEDFGSRIGADVERFVREGKRELEQHAEEHPQPLFALLRALRPVLLIHDIAIVTRYPDVVAVLTNDQSFSVQPYSAKMCALAGDLTLG